MKANVLEMRMGIVTYIGAQFDAVMTIVANKFNLVVLFLCVTYRSKVQIHEDMKRFSEG